MIRQIHNPKRVLDPQPAVHVLFDGLGYIRLVDYMGADLTVARAARVSYDADWRATGDKTDEGLLNYMQTNKHTSPFEHVVMQFEVQAPIFVFRQWHRHRTQSYNEVSARYAELDIGNYVPPAWLLGIQDKKNHQGRIVSDPDAMTESERLEAEESIGMMEDSITACRRTYSQLLARGVPREIARSVLQVNEYSRMYVTANLHNWFHFVTLRMDEHAQWEIRQYAQVVYEYAQQIAPIATKAFGLRLESDPVFKSMFFESNRDVAELPA